VVAGTADYHRRPRARRRGVGRVGVQQRQAVELASGVVRGEHERRAVRIRGRDVRGRRRGAGDDPFRVNDEAVLREPRRERLTMELREVGHDTERDAASLQPAHRIHRPGERLALEDEHAVGVEHEPADAADCVAQSLVGAALPSIHRHRSMVGFRPRSRAEGSMGLLDGRNALVFGVANDHSLAWGIAKAFHDEGAEVGFSSVESLIERRVRPLADSIGSTFVEPCDVGDDAQIERVFDRWAESHDRLDVLVHALAFAKREELDGAFTDTSREGFALALDISAYSLIGLSRAARPLLRRGSSIQTLTYYGSEKVVANYNVMGVAKAALEASVRYLAADLGPDGIRVNAISAGPVRTLAAAGIAGFKGMYRGFTDIAPLRANITPEDVGRTAVYLASDLSSAMTGEVLYVDGGFNVVGVPLGD
jgi:enoyl-[acyl-carrier protein] reductase I